MGKTEVETRQHHRSTDYEHANAPPPPPQPDSSDRHHHRQSSPPVPPPLVSSSPPILQPPRHPPHVCSGATFCCGRWSWICLDARMPPPPGHARIDGCHERTALSPYHRLPPRLHEESMVGSQPTIAHDWRGPPLPCSLQRLRHAEPPPPPLLDQPLTHLVCMCVTPPCRRHVLGPPPVLLQRYCCVLR